jgi:hypothetical protein
MRCHHAHVTERCRRDGGAHRMDLTGACSPGQAQASSPPPRDGLVRGVHTMPYVLSA